MTTFRELLKNQRVSLDYWRVDPYRDGPDGLEPGEGISYGSLEAANTANADAVGHRYLSGSDYSGGVLIRANIACVRDLLAKNPDAPIVFAHGGYGTEAVVFLLDREAPEEQISPLVELLCGLEDYPSVDDEKLSELEEEDAAETWESWARKDFERALAKRVVDSNSDACLSADDVELDWRGTEARDVFHALAERWNVEGGAGVVHEDSGASFDVERVAEKTSPVVLFALGVVKFDADAMLGLAADESESARGEARRLARLSALGTQLRSLADRLISECFGRDYRGRYDAARRAIVACSVDAGDTSAELQAGLPTELLSATVTFRGYTLKPDYRAPDRTFPLTVSS
jgi:hypothetical protein